MQEICIWSLGQEDPLEEEMATHSNILAWEIPWTEETGGLQSTGSQSRTWLSDWVCRRARQSKANQYFALTSAVFLSSLLSSNQRKSGLFSRGDDSLWSFVLATCSPKATKRIMSSAGEPQSCCKYKTQNSSSKTRPNASPVVLDFEEKMI